MTTLATLRTKINRSPVKRFVEKRVDAIRFFTKGFPIRAHHYLLEKTARHHYPSLSEETLLSTRKTDTVFVLGSGASINEISDNEWKAMEAFDTFSISQFYRNEKVRVDYHMLAEIWDVEDCGQILSSNPKYENTLYFLQEGWEALQTNLLVGQELLPKGNPIFRFKRICRSQYAPPSESFQRGIVHGYNSTIDAANICYLMGWKRIVMVGVDLYDKRYFYLPHDGVLSWEPPGITASSRFPYGDEIVDTFEKWNHLWKPQNVKVLTYNPKSLLAQKLDVFKFDGQPQ